MSQQSTTPLSTVTYEEVIAKLIKSKALKLVEGAVNKREKDAWNAARGEPLADLKHRLDRCATDDGLVAWIKFLEAHYLWIPDPALKSKNRVMDTEIDATIEKLEGLRSALEQCEEKLDEELEATDCRIAIAHSVSGQDLYETATVAQWAREELDVILPEWEDLKNYDLFAPRLPRWIDADKERLDAHFDVLDAQLRAALNISRSGTAQPDFIKPFKLWKNGKPNRNGFLNLVKQSLTNIASKRADKTTAKIPWFMTSAVQERLKVWHAYFDNPIDENRGIYTSTTVTPVRQTIAALAIAFEGKEYTSKLLEAEQAPWPRPTQYRFVDLNRIKGVHSNTAKHIIDLAIEEVMDAVTAAGRDV